MTEDLIARLREPRNSSIHGGCQNCDDALKEEAAAAIAQLRADNERLNDRNVEVSMLAHKWMVAHDKRAAGMPYDFPSPADLPASEAEVERLRVALEPFSKIAPSSFYAADGSEAEGYCVFLANQNAAQPVFTGADLARARSALSPEAKS